MPMIELCHTNKELCIRDFDKDWVKQPWKLILDRLGRPCAKGDVSVFAFLLRKCGDAKALAEGKKVHAHIINGGHVHDKFLGNLLIQMYGKCGAVKAACGVFANLNHRNVFSWALMIGACLQNGQSREALKFFEQMEIDGVKPDKVTCVHILTACASQAALAEGKRLHASIAGKGIESDVAVSNALLNMYGKCGSLDMALNVFEKMPELDIVSWNTLLAVYAQHGQTKKAFNLFKRMHLEDVIPNTFSYVSALDACSRQVDLVESKRMHARIVASQIESDVVVASALVNVYGKSGHLECAWRVFDKMGERSVVSWSVIIAAYAQHGHLGKAYQLFQQMRWEGVLPNKVTCLTILDTCANHVALAEGKRMHSYIGNSGFELDAVMATSLVNMYSKCGSIGDARREFDNMPERDVVLWSAMIIAAAQHGQVDQALQLFQQMQLEGITPNRVTFFGILSACSHAGLVDECWYYLNAMTQVHNITPDVEHYNCVVDLFGRIGRLEEGESLIRNMPVQPTAMSWMTLLAACKMHVDILRGERAAENVSRLDPEDAAAYVLLSNIYAAVGK